MKNRLRVVVIVSSDPSDIYFANQLISNVNVVGVVIACNTVQKLKDSPFLGYLIRPLSLVKKIFVICMQRFYAFKAKKIAITGFGKESLKVISNNYLQIINVANGDSVNNGRYINKIKELKPDIIAVCGGPMLSDAVLSIPYKGLINLHGGLSQRYRGVWTTMWAIYNEEPEWVGYTVHYISKGVDTGDVIAQGRPIIEEADNHETLYVKVVILGASEVIKAIKNIEAGTSSAVSLLEKGKLYKSAEATPTVIRNAWNKIHSGLIKDYVNNPKKVELIK